MKRNLWIFSLFSLFCIFAIWAIDQNGTVYVRWFEVNKVFPLWLFCFIVLIVVFLGMFSVWAINKLVGKQLAESVKTSRQVLKKINKEEVDEAMFALLKTMTATTEGDMKAARKNLKVLEGKIGHSTITEILELKILKGEKNFDAVEKLSNKLMKNKDSELVGLKALIETSSKKKDFQKALENANKAFETRQDLYWVIENTFHLRALASDWKGASEVLDIGYDKKMLPAERYHALKAIALYQEALERKKEGFELGFLKCLMHASELSPSFEPSALALAEFYEKEGQIRKAEKVLKNIWRVSPTYDVAKAYLKLYQNDSPLERVQRMESFAFLNVKEASLNNLILAELDVKAKLWDKAKSELEIFLINNPATKKIAKLMSVYEKTADKNIKASESWEKRIDDCVDECLWVCESCKETSSKWKPFCNKCGAFNPYKWHLCLKKRNKN